jgi:hypothetical protein
MKLIPAVCICLLILSVSCKKSNDQPNTPPPATDTAKIPVVKVDTSTLVKTMREYFYDASGTTITDSLLEEWQYDNLRRVVRQALKASTYTDTMFYTYFNDHYIREEHAHTSSSPSNVIRTVYYQHLQNSADSVIASNGNNVYYYYNQMGQDSVEKQIGSTDDPALPAFTTNYYYTGQNLDSSIFRWYGRLSNIYHYTDGNMTENDAYTLDANSVLEMTNKIAYTDIPVGGLRVCVGTSKLRLGSNLVYFDRNASFVETNSYQMDAANRVTVWLVDEHQSDFHKYLFSYY